MRQTISAPKHSNHPWPVPSNENAHCLLQAFQDCIIEIDIKKWIVL